MWGRCVCVLGGGGTTGILCGWWVVDGGWDNSPVSTAGVFPGYFFLFGFARVEVVWGGVGWGVRYGVG